jgi:hypothetical protein
LALVIAEPLIAHKNAFEIAHVLHRDISLYNLFLCKAPDRDKHVDLVKNMSGLSADAQAMLCDRIGNVKRRGLLGDWGYGVPTTGDSSPTRPGTPDGAPSQTADKSTNSVPVVPVLSKNAEPKYTLVSNLTKDDDVTLAMGFEADPENDIRCTNDTSPLYRTVRSTLHVQ